MMPSGLLLSAVFMHIPDGFLSLPVLALCWLLTAFFVGMALRHTRDTLGERQAPFMGVMAATIFAAQMLNFPVVGGTSGHLIGGALVAMLLGPWAAVLVMTSVVTLQALIFLDGGLLALGANILIMGVLCPWVGYGMYRVLVRVHADAAVFLAAWVSVVVAATAVSLALWLSGTASLPIVLRAMVGIHALIGLGEGALTLAILHIMKRGQIVPWQEATFVAGTGGVAAGWRLGLAFAVVLALLSPLASPWPDGLERVASDLGFMGRAQTLILAPLPDYTVPGISIPILSVILAGGTGVLVAFAVGYVLAQALAHGRSG